MKPTLDKKIFYTKLYKMLEDVTPLTCTGTCDRVMRPLAKAMRLQDLDPLFVKRVTSAMKLCMMVRDTREFIYSLSEDVDEMRSFLL